MGRSAIVLSKITEIFRQKHSEEAAARVFIHGSLQEQLLADDNVREISDKFIPDDFGVGMPPMQAVAADLSRPKARVIFWTQLPDTA